MGNMKLKESRRVSGSSAFMYVHTWRPSTIATEEFYTHSIRPLFQMNSDVLVILIMLRLRVPQLRTTVTFNSLYWSIYEGFTERPVEVAEEYT